MAHHKRHRPRNRRGGCKLCKPWKINGFRTERADGEKYSDHRRRTVADEQIRVSRKGRASACFSRLRLSARKFIAAAIVTSQRNTAE